MKLHNKLAIALLLGIALGAMLHPYAGAPWLAAISTHVLRPIGQIFLRTIFMIVVPMVFSALVVGVYQLGRGHDLPGVAGRTLAFTLLLSSTSVAIGMILVNVLQPGAGLQLSAGDAASGVDVLRANAAAAQPLSDILIQLIPRNPLESAVRALDGEMLPLMVFAVIFGVAVSQIAGGQGARGQGGEDPVLVRVLEQIFDACMWIVHLAMRLAPVAVFAIVFNTAFTFGTGVFATLLFYVVTVVAGLLIQQFGVYAALLWTAARRPPLEFFRNCREVYLYAFSTASSNATLPLSLDVAERKLRLPPQISRFVLTVGSTANQNGTALFEGVTVLFLAQVYGLDLTLAQQIRVMVMSIVAGIGTAGVPGGSLPMVMIVAQSVGVPAEGMALILGVDRFLDMCRTAVNVSGDLVIAALVSARPGRA
ncbi:MAG: sodium:proton symporter [Acidobacteria bacterium RIFCSPLOWO2_12_FULL_67_14]|nr:MAG: sodium:proton symporter [Acidobacteria bacterium RIFCSPLOWO2_02_FULL_67_21]OFW38512.1 MAG: sodium:proton symporter [Acidobacteria bacterium RIFCSPLOWO2_12_FULL_67_14]